MRAEISFDTIVPTTGTSNIEGCYRLEGEDWRVFFFTHRYEGESRVIGSATWQSGIAGVDVRYPKDKILNKDSVKEALSNVLGVGEWSEVRGPDSLQLK